MKKILITGGLGLTGSSLLTLMSHSQIIRDAEVYCTYRNTIPNPSTIFKYIRVEDLSDVRDWHSLLSAVNPSCIVVISNIRHVTPLLQALSENNSLTSNPRLIVVGTTGVHSLFNDYSLEYKNIENLISGYLGEYLVLRPSMIYGNKRDKNIHKIVRFIKHFKFFVVFGPGDNIMHPIHFNDLGAALFASINSPSLAGYYDVAGKYPMTYSEIIHSIFDYLELNPFIVRVPIWLALLISHLFSFLPCRMRLFTREQVLRLTEHKLFDYRPLRDNLKYNPIGFTELLEIRGNDYDEI